MNKFCIYCGVELKEGQAFCGNCGKSTGEVSCQTEDVTDFSTEAYVENVYEDSVIEETEKSHIKYWVIGVIVAILVVFIAVVSSVKDDKEVHTTSVENNTYEVDSKEEKSKSEENDNFTIGTVDNGIYENKYLGIRCELPDWKYSDRKTLMLATDMAADLILDNIDDEEFTQLFKEQDTFMDMQAFHKNGYTNVNVMVQNIADEIYDTLGEETTMMLLASQMPEYYKNMGMPLDACQTMEVDVNGKTKFGIYISYTNNGVTAHMLQFVNIKSEHSATITITGASKEECLLIKDSLFFS